MKTSVCDRGSVFRLTSCRSSDWWLHTSVWTRQRSSFLSPSVCVCVCVCQTVGDLLLRVRHKWPPDRTSIGTLPLPSPSPASLICLCGPQICLRGRRWLRQSRLLATEAQAPTRRSISWLGKSPRRLLRSSIDCVTAGGWQSIRWEELQGQRCVRAETLTASVNADVTLRKGKLERFYTRCMKIDSLL